MEFSVVLNAHIGVYLKPKSNFEQSRFLHNIQEKVKKTMDILV